MIRINFDFAAIVVGEIEKQEVTTRLMIPW